MENGPNMLPIAVYSTLIYLIPSISCGFKYADDNGGYRFCWTNPFVRLYDVPVAREKAIAALSKEFNASFCDISYVRTQDPWFRTNQTRYKIFLIADNLINDTIIVRHDKVKKIIFPIFQISGCNRVEILAYTREEKPEGHFTEEEMHFKFNYLDIPVYGGNRLKRQVTDIADVVYNTTPHDMEWKFHPNKTCRLVVETVRKNLECDLVECKSLKDELLEKNVAPGHEDQYKLLVISKTFLGQPPLKRTMKVRKILKDLVSVQMYKIHMVLKTKQEYEAEKNIVTTTDFAEYV